MGYINYFFFNFMAKKTIYFFQVNLHFRQRPCKCHTAIWYQSFYKGRNDILFNFFFYLLKSLQSSLSSNGETERKIEASSFVWFSKLTVHDMKVILPWSTFFGYFPENSQNQGKRFHNRQTSRNSSDLLRGRNPRIEGDGHSVCAGG